MDMKKLYEDFSSHVNQLSDIEIRESIDKAARNVNRSGLELYLDQIKEIVKQMEKIGATHIVFHADVNSETTKVEKLFIDAFDSDGFCLDTIYTLYNDD